MRFCAYMRNKFFLLPFAFFSGAIFYENKCGIMLILTELINEIVRLIKRYRKVVENVAEVLLVSNIF